MSGTWPEKMLVLDFSGTLSLAAPRFGRPDNLVRALQETGLWQMGVNSIDIFWNDIVNPTWLEGSTTSKGYQQLLFEQVRRRLAGRSDGPEDEIIRHSAALFVNRYLAGSTIEPAWQPFLRFFVDRPDLLLLIGSDHYAEATGHIRRQLDTLDLPNAPALEPAGSGRIYVANSADIGHPKASQPFWEIIREAHGLDSLAKIVIIDDFGLNEQVADSYAAQHRVIQRLDQTVRLLTAIFQADTLAFPFFLSGETDAVQARSDYENLIDRAEQFARQALVD